MLKINLLQTPNVELDGKPVVFPFKRADALLYYMVVRRSATRQELISLLWESCDESVGLKNLRNTLYTLKKQLGGEFLLSPQKSMIVLNSQWEWECDYHRFAQGDFSAYQGAFLQGFSVKNAFTYEEWLERTREKIHAQYIKRLSEQARGALAQGDREKAVQFAELYLQEDPYDEEMVTFLISLYRQARQYAKASLAYQRLKDQLSAEMGTDPQENTTMLYYETMNEWNDAAKFATESAQRIPIGREEHYAALRAAVSSLGENAARRCSQLLVGEAGSGKSQLLEYFVHAVDLSDFLVLHCTCMRLEEQSPLSPFAPLSLPLQQFLQREEIPLPTQAAAELSRAFLPENQEPLALMLRRADTLIEHILQMMAAVIRRKKVLLIVEDIQWADKESLVLLDGLLRRLGSVGLMAVLTCREDCSQPVQEFQTKALADGLLRLQRLHPLTQNQTREMLHRDLGEGIAEQIAPQFYQQTGGNLRFISELIAAYKRSGDLDEVLRTMDDILMERLVGLGEEAVQVAELISVFPKEAPCSLLLQLIHQEDRILTTGIQELWQRGLIEEILVEGEANYRFTHQRLRGLVYDRLTYFARKPLHLQVAQLLTNSAPIQDVQVSNRIAAHFNLAGDSLHAAQYRIRALEMESAHSCDPFGAYPAQLATRKTSGELAEDVKQEMAKLHRLRRECADPDSVAGLERMLLLIRGRIALFEGRISEGATLLGNLSGDAEGKHGILMVKACHMLAQSALLTQDVALAERYTLTGLRMLERSKASVFTALFQRLRGNCFCLRGEYEKSIYYLLEAAEELGQYSATHPCQHQLAGAYYDYGRVCGLLKDYAKASSYYKKALSLLEETPPAVGRVWVHANYGRLAFILEDQMVARKQFALGYQAGQTTQELWGMTVAAGFTAYYEMLDGAYHSSASLLSQARQTAEKLGSPLEKAILCYVSMLMRDKLDQQGCDCQELQQLLPYSVESYARQGTRLLPGVPDIFEVEQLSRRLREGIATKNRYKASELYSKNKHFMTE